MWKRSKPLERVGFSLALRPSAFSRAAAAGMFAAVAANLSPNAASPCRARFSVMRGRLRCRATI
jgi:hypothetical protein